ncbi:hypothetical protein SAMN05443572_104183 [Myxococcus fulvus]|uniref:Uncharacterized protein n=1 Tax=Myxococcus fulvus TaxID=33 RepID=A0ABY1CEK7_MYXFU|nr:DUF6183 family protein [Myxococcus fulvus]SET98163.1 hypothetical protein SAMN05443572_104183 [Myxococcus fulvus]
MSSTVSAFLDDISTRDGLKAARAHIGRLGDERAWPALVALAAELEARQASTPAEARERLHALSDHIEEVLAKGQDVDSALALLEVARQPRDARYQGRLCASRRERELASLLATHRPATSFVELFSHRRGPEDLLELFACGVHELVLRGADLSSVPGVLALQEELSRRGHPLAVLPLQRRRWESSFGRLMGTEELDPYDTLGERLSSASREDEEDEYTAPDIRLATQDEPVPPALAAVLVSEDGEGPHEAIEQRVLKLRPALPKAPSDTMTSLLIDLNLPLMKDAAFVVCERDKLSRVADFFFSRVVSRARGWLGAAYGRLALWRTLEALGGIEVSWSTDAPEKRWNACTWYQFNGSWQDERPRIQGVVCLRPGGTSLALVAVRDTTSLW